MKCVTFHATNLCGQNGRLFLTEPGRPQTPTFLAPGPYDVEVVDYH